MSHGSHDTSHDMSHGGNVFRAELDLGLRGTSVLDFSASINPMGMPPAARHAIKTWVGDVLHYPDIESTRLKEAVAERFGLDPASVLPGNGSTELIYLIPRALKPRNVLIASPTFSEYERACGLSGARVEHFEMAASGGFLPDMDSFGRAMNNSDMAFFCNPGNPSGAVLPRDDVLELASLASNYKCVLVVDEAFMEFCPEHSVLGEDGEYLIVLRSLTKFYALAGLRAGFACMPPQIMKAVLKYKEPWSVNVLAERAAVVALGQSGFINRSLKYVERERDLLRRKLEALGFIVYPSHANYLLFETSKAERLVRGLYKRGILVRDCSNFRGLGHKHLRVAVRTRKENSILVTAMAGILEGEK